jgi:hypothetical protein
MSCSSSPVWNYPDQFFGFNRKPLELIKARASAFAVLGFTDQNKNALDPKRLT